MKHTAIFILIICLLMSACSMSTPSPTPTASPTVTDGPTSTPRVVMLPTWTPSPTTPPKPSPTPRNTSTPISTFSVYGVVTPSSLATELLIDRPVSSELAQPANLVTMQYKTGDWILNSFYATNFMGYSLGSRSIYGCNLEPVMTPDTEGYQLETYNRQFETATFTITRMSQAGELLVADYCTGEAEDATCYQVTPGDDHEACLQAAEQVLATYELVANPWYGTTLTSNNHWACQDSSGTVGLCLISYSVPLNTLAYTVNSQGWAGGDDGILLQQQGQAWKQVESPSSYPLYDLSFDSQASGWAVGAGAQVLAWDGNAWKEILPYHAAGEGPGGSTQTLYGVDAVSKDDAWMVGNMLGVDGKYQPYALHWDGQDLIEQNNFPECNCGMNAVLEVASNDVFGVGGSDMGAMAFHWDGTEWTSSTLSGADHLYTIIRAPDGTLWAGGIEIARDQSDTRGALFHWDGSAWQRVATPPLTGGIYALSALRTGQIVLGGDLTALRSALGWQPIVTDIAGYGWITDMAQDPQGNVWSLTHSGNLFKLVISK